MLQVRTSYLEDENRHLQQRVDSLAAQKQTLDKLVKDFQHNRDREVGLASPALASCCDALVMQVVMLVGKKEMGEEGWARGGVEQGRGLSIRVLGNN